MDNKPKKQPATQVSDYSSVVLNRSVEFKVVGIVVMLPVFVGCTGIMLCSIFALLTSNSSVLAHLWPLGHGVRTNLIATPFDNAVLILYALLSGTISLGTLHYCLCSWRDTVTLDENGITVSERSFPHWSVQHTRITWEEVACVFTRGRGKKRIAPSIYTTDVNHSITVGGYGKSGQVMQFIERHLAEDKIMDSRAYNNWLHKNRT